MLLKIISIFKKKRIKRRYLILLITIIVLLLILRNITKDYEASYDINKYNVEEIVKDKTITINIKNDGVVYKYLLLSKRKAKRKIVKEIKEEIIDEYTCLTPIIDKISTYTICYKDGEFVDKDLLVNNLEYQEISSDIKYNELGSEEYMLVWKYDGFYSFNKDEQNTINLLDKNRYSNDLMKQIDKYLLFPKYEEDYTFTDFHLIDMTNLKSYTIKGTNEISYDSYYCGQYKNNIYLFDNKNENLYKINYKKKTYELIGSNLIGYEKLVNGKVKKADLKEYTIDKITYFNDEENLISVVDNYIEYDNFKYRFATNDIKVIYSNNYDVFYIYKDNIYKYSLNKTKEVLHYFELNFNSDNTVFIYQK